MKKLLYSQEIYVRAMTWLYAKYKPNVTPNQVTMLSFVMGMLAGILFFFGHFIIGIVLLHLSVCCDRLDGHIARERKMVSKLGWWLDSFSDRLVDFTVFMGLAAFTGMWFIGFMIIGPFYLIVYGYLSVRWNIDTPFEDSVYTSRIKKLFAYSRTNIYILLIPFIIIGNIPLYLYIMLVYSWGFYVLLISNFTFRIRGLQCQKK